MIAQCLSKIFFVYTNNVQYSLTYFSEISQFLLGEKHAFIFSENYETEMWIFCLCAVTANPQYFI